MNEEARIREAYARRGHVARESWFNAAHRFMLQDREHQVLRLLAREGMTDLTGTRVLEVGCGTGQWLRDFVKWGARPCHLTGIDLLPDRIAAARELCPPAITLACGSAARLPFDAAAFDVVLQSTVFTSILDPAMRRAVANEMMRVVRPGGVIVWYDYHTNNPANPDVRAVPRREIHELFPGCRINLRRVTLAPPVARAVAPVSTLACHLLAALPLLRTHYLGALRAPEHV